MRGLLLALAAGAALAAPPRILDGFETVRAWKAVPSDGVLLALGGAGSLRMDFDFQGRGGYAAARRDLPLTLPPNYEITFLVRGDCPPENLEFKLVDPSGENVWWVRKPAFAFPREWTRVTLKKRQVSFAWGPGGADPTRIASVEWCVTAGSGGKGRVEFRDLAIRELPVEVPYDRTPAATSGPGWSQLDFRIPREFGGLRIDWADPGPRDFRVLVSPDGSAWTPLREVRGAAGPASHLLLPETEARFLRVEGGAAKALAVRPLAFGESWNAAFETLAREAPRGDYPRCYLGEQPYWTLVGVDGGLDSALLSEDGALEAGVGGPSVEPFLWSGGQLLGWAQAACAQSLERGALPIPTVTRTHGDLTLRVTAFGAGSPAAPVIRARYRLSSASPWKGTLFLAVRPFQVNPPVQFLGTPGGAAAIGTLAFGGDSATVDGKVLLRSATRPDGAGAVGFHGGSIVDYLHRGALPPAATATDPAGHASGALRYDVDLAPGEVRDILVDLPLLGAGPRPPFEADLREAVASWDEKLNRVRVELPEPGAADTLRTCLAHILISRKGPALRPGTRSYARSWIRDGAMMSAALLRMGHADEVRDYIEWYAPYLYPNGKVPCVVDDRGADPVPENDSPGEFLHLLAEYARCTGDRAFLARLWPQGRRAADYLEGILEKNGLVPASISHEGYSAKPMHSYWDDFWSLRGFRDAAWICGELGDSAGAAHFAALETRFRGSLLASIQATMAAHRVDYIPGCAELGDFDATSTTVALMPGDELGNLPRSAVEATFAEFYRQFRVRRQGGAPGDRYTPYETRTIGAFAQLGWVDRAQELLGAYLEDRRPLAWNQWPEVVQRDPRSPVFLGDLPHAWVGSDYIRSLLSLLVRERGDALVLGAGVPATWLAKGVRLEGLRVPGGELGFSARTEAGRVVVEITGTAPCPRGGVVVRWPLPGAFRRARVDGRIVEGSTGTELTLRRIPATVVMEP
ncbi:discoidin domain-containing protein [Mesoterricola silvestris]|uniref:F5/8 type C domain-containing protein n=1 Tax=Mesoterricola silvestris TaxID=2927979 RepID=A0AA48K7B7_9BACT|nr:discoidin domain-containing protein [Mesoterricola silvestris]BDU71689.1 hypothetical protein METEAL_08630 [Mesoterricola silvestris]